MAINWKVRGYTPEQFTEAWLASNSVFEVGRRLGKNATGSGHKDIKDAAEALGLNRDHMTGQAWNRGRKTGPRRPIEELLVSGSRISGGELLNRLVAAGLKERRCELCDITEWRGKPAPLELDHKNGDHYDNRLENLRVLCRNCHGQQPTHAGRNKRSNNPERLVCPDCGEVKTPSAVRCGSCHAKWVDERRQENLPALTVCPECNGTKSHRSVRCRECSRKNHSSRMCERCGGIKSPSAKQCMDCARSNRETVIDWPSNDEMLEVLAHTSMTQYANSLGVSANAMKKRLVKAGHGEKLKELDGRLRRSI